MSTARRPGPTTIDFKDPDTWLAGVPHTEIAAIRRTTPVYWNNEADDSGFWAVLRHADIVEVSRKPKLFSSASANGGHRIFNENEVSVANTNDSSLGVPFISMDPPEHQKRRMQIVPPLSQAKLKDMAARIEQRAKDLLAAVPAGSEVEWVDAVSAPFPLMTLVKLLGVAQDDWRKFYHWTNAFIGEDDPEFRASPEDMGHRMQEFGAYFAWLYEARRKNPGDDVASMLANASSDGQDTSVGQFLADMILVTVGGNETVRNSISHGLRAFSDNPAQWDSFRASEEHHTTAVQEIVRYASPVLHMRRTAIEDTSIGDTRITAGDKVVLWYVAANRDETVFADPNRFDIRRNDGKHVGFGTGQHVCVGQRLADLQIRILFREMARRYSGFEFTREPPRLRSNFINGLKSVHVVPRGP
jgi:linalool 8-monooxygenase